MQYTGSSIICLRKKKGNMSLKNAIVCQSKSAFYDSYRKLLLDWLFLTDFCVYGVEVEVFFKTVIFFGKPAC